MTGTTPIEGYPYPLPAGFADVQDAFRLATEVDADLRANQAPFRAFIGRPSFIGRSTSNGSGFISGSQDVSAQAIDWDNTGGLTINQSKWNQPNNQQPSWWMFGCTILAAIISGTPVVGDLNMGRLNVTTTDQVTGIVTTSPFYQRNDETNTGGEWINLFAMAPIYQGSVTAALVLNGSTQKSVQAGSRFWGFYMGPVI
jgi:hypothetical protein